MTNPIKIKYLILIFIQVKHPTQKGPVSGLGIKLTTFLLWGASITIHGEILNSVCNVRGSDQHSCLGCSCKICLVTSQREWRWWTFSHILSDITDTKYKVSKSRFCIIWDTVYTEGDGCTVYSLCNRDDIFFRAVRPLRRREVHRIRHHRDTGRRQGGSLLL